MRVKQPRIITASLQNTWAGKPWGIHGFIAGAVVSLVLIVLLSLIKWNPPEGHLERIWGEK